MKNKNLQSIAMTAKGLNLKIAQPIDSRTVVSTGTQS